MTSPSAAVLVSMPDRCSGPREPDQPPPAGGQQDPACQRSVLVAVSGGRDPGCGYDLVAELEPGDESELPSHGGTLCRVEHDRAHHLMAVFVAVAAVLPRSVRPSLHKANPGLRNYVPAPREATLTAQYQLALQFQIGRALPHDDAEAAAWLLRAAEQDHVEAQLLLGLQYRAGRGVPQDDFEAAAWVRMAVDGGHPDALFFLAAMYREGRGVLRDRVRACMWHILSASRSNDRNREASTHIARQQCSELTHAEAGEAQRLAREWDEAHPQTAEDGRVR